MTLAQNVLKEYFMVRRRFLHHVLLGLLIGLVAWAAVMWFVTDRYVDSTVEATVQTDGTYSAGDGTEEGRVAQEEKPTLELQVQEPTRTSTSTNTKTRR
jgi:hypothetical protein